MEEKIKYQESQELRSFKVPILFIVFNRIETTRIVFERIRSVKPKKLFIVADGPRATIKGEAEKCAEVRKYILENLDWECEVHTKFREKNLGVRLSPVDGIDWFFEKNESGIILEDDCLPNVSFFRFMEEMLEIYGSNERVMHVSGNCFQPKAVGAGSYFFSRLPHIWGWGTWRRAWKKYDVNMVSYPDFIHEKKLRNIFLSDYVRTEWKCLFDQAKKKDFNGWDFQWTYALFSHSGLAITPNKNLVKNIGFAPSATHSRDMDDPLAKFETEELSFPLSYASMTLCEVGVDEYESRHFLNFSYKKYILCKIGLFALFQKIYWLLR